MILHGAMASEANTLRKLEEMMTQVDYLRAGCHQIFQGFVNLSRSPAGTENGQLAKMVSNNVRFVVKAIKRMSDLGKDVQPHLLSPPSGALVEGLESNKKGNIYAEEPVPNLHAILHLECKWRDAIRDGGGFATTAYDRQLSLRFPLLSPPPAKRPKLTVRPPSIADDTILTFEKLVQELCLVTQLKLEPLMSSAGGILGIRATFDGVFKATLLFQECSTVWWRTVAWDNQFGKSGDETGWKVEHVILHGIDEEEAGMWQISKHNVFRAISLHVAVANKHFQEHYPPFAIKKLLVWLESYGSLYTDACKGCKKHLYNDSEHHGFLPPTWRTLNRQAYHPQCLSSLTMFASTDIGVD